MCLTDVSFADLPASESVEICEICGPLPCLPSARVFLAVWQEWEIELHFDSTLDEAQNASRTPNATLGEM